MGLRFVLDSNVVLHEIRGSLARSLPEGTHFVSIVSKVELVSFREITPEQEPVLRDFLDSVTIVDLGGDVAEEAHLLKLPDAAIAATDRVVGAELLTFDKGLLKVPGLNVSAPALK